MPKGTLKKRLVKPEVKAEVPTNYRSDEIFVIASVAAPIYAGLKLQPNRIEDQTLFYDDAIAQALELIYRVDKMGRKIEETQRDLREKGTEAGG